MPLPESKIAEQTDKIADATQALYSAREMIRGFMAHLTYTLPAKPGAVSKVSERDAQLLQAQATTALQRLTAALPADWK